MSRSEPLTSARRRPGRGRAGGGRHGTIGSSESLRHAMVDRLAADHAAKGLALRPEVEAALRAVPRELYTPGLPREEAYENAAVITKRRGEETISSVSAPFLIAEMLGQAADALGSLKGRHVIEFGSGGYNASLLRELVGPSGSVTTVDIDPDVTDRAAACLETAGYNDVTAVCADAEHPIEPGRRYDLIIVTAGAWDIPPAWREQLTDGGVLVVPLRTFGMTRSWALRRSGDRLVSESHRQCGFVSMQGAGAHEMRYLDIADGVHLVTAVLVLPVSGHALRLVHRQHRGRKQQHSGKYGVKAGGGSQRSDHGKGQYRVCRHACHDTEGLQEARLPPLLSAIRCSTSRWVKAPAPVTSATSRRCSVLSDDAGALDVHPTSTTVQTIATAMHHAVRMGPPAGFVGRP